MWYYTLNNQQVGPVDENEMKRLVASGVITHATMVWTTGMATWQLIGQTPLASLMGTVAPPPVGAFPPAMVYEDPKVKKQKDLFKWYWILIASGIGLAVLGGILILTGNFRVIVSATVLAYLSMLPIIAAGVLFFIMIYKAWKLVQHEGIRATPDQAVAYCFIPGWNYYWYFPAFRGLAQEINSKLDKENIAAERISLDLVTWMIICLLASPITFGVSLIPFIVLWVMYTNKVKNASIAIIQATKA